MTTEHWKVFLGLQAPVGGWEWEEAEVVVAVARVTTQGTPRLLSNGHTHLWTNLHGLTIIVLLHHNRSTIMTLHLHQWYFD